MYVSVCPLVIMPPPSHTHFRVMGKLPDEHQLFLHYLFHLLHHISNNEEVNCMNTINLAICFAPSLLWPDSGLDVIKNEVPPLVQFLVEHSPKIFGAELPELYKHVMSPGSSGVEQMEFSYEPSPSLVPTKMRDGSESSHKRSESMDSSLSEDSLYNKNSLLRAKRNGLTFSDSQLSTISQHDYEPPRRTGSKHESHHTPSTHGPPLGAPVNKRVKKISQPKRSSSLQGSNDMSPSSRRFYERRQLEARRRSLAMQDLPLKKQRQEYTPGVLTIPDSPVESQSSSSQDYNSPHLLPRGGQYYSDNRHMYHQYNHEQQRHSPKKRRAPQHSNSFSKGSENKPVKTMASSASWYDRLLPLEPDAKIKSRSMGTSLGNRMPLPDEVDNQQLRMRVGSGPIREDRVFDGHSPRFLVASYPSNQSVSSSRSGSSASGAMYLTRGSSKPSNISMSSVSSGGANQGPVDPFAPIDPSLYTIADTKISQRFDLTDATSSLHPPPTSATPGSYYVPVTESDVPSTHSTASRDEQLKPTDRKRMNSTTSVVSESSFSTSKSYKGFLSSQQKKDSLLSLTQASLDDRPESDQHLNSLPRPRTAEHIRPEKQMPSTILYPSMATAPQVLQVGPVLETTPDHDPNKLYPGNGYNSDTESSPSRTLSRPDRKILEVTSPGITMPKRYGRIGYPTHGKKLLKAHTIDDPSPRMQVDTPPSKETIATVPTETPREELSTSDHSAQEQAPAGSSPSTKQQRPKSGESSKIGQLVKTYSKPTLDPNYETAKVRLGLIPPIRQRSKSTSEKEAMRIIHKIIEEDESVAKTTEEEERAEKHKAWASSAPTTADRKKAWESLSRDSFKRAEIRSRSLKHETVVPVVEKPPPKPSMTPEMKRKSATMPEYLVTGPKRIRGMGRQIRTYKVALYDAPKPERIRRINLRTMH